MTEAKPPKLPSAIVTLLKQQALPHSLHSGAGSPQHLHNCIETMKKLMAMENLEHAGKRAQMRPMLMESKKTNATKCNETKKAASGFWTSSSASSSRLPDSKPSSFSPSLLLTTTNASSSCCFLVFLAAGA
jgi:uncharacterized protein involved in copper resistance